MDKQKVAMQKLLSGLRRAVSDHKMIEDGDKIAVGVSGGKDSLALLAALANYKLFSLEKFELTAVTVDMGFKDMDFSPITEYCNALEIKHKIIKTELAEIIFEIRKEPNPCSLCSKMRRGALNTAINEMGIKKLALGHHADDLIETFMLSLVYEGRLSAFKPVSFMDRSGVTMIRPFIYIEEKDIRAYSKHLPVVHNTCPADKHTQRQYMKDLIKSIQKDIPFIKQRMHGAIINPDRYSLWQPYEQAKRPSEGKSPKKN